ncbi:MAG: quinol dehydrogenase ferredoxin subunit NapH [Pseudomonadota bacterium]
MAERRSWIARHRWLIARRSVQLSVLALFLIGPYAGLWALKGNLASSVLLDTISLTDPFIAVQSLAAGHKLETAAIAGALTVAAFYMLLGGRSFCAWVCPINPVTDAAAVLRERLGVKTNIKVPRQTSLALVPILLVLSAITGTIAFETINPITMLHRGLLFGLGMAWLALIAVFVFDVALVKHGWCGHICPVGAFYGLLGKASLIKVSAAKRSQCTDCGDCFRVCPEPHVIAPALYPKQATDTPLITNTDCISCGKCIDVCDDDVFSFASRLGTKKEAAAS